MMPRRFCISPPRGATPWAVGDGGMVIRSVKARAPWAETINDRDSRRRPRRQLVIAALTKPECGLSRDKPKAKVNAFKLASLGAYLPGVC
jgi:hypothetical protein